MQPEGLVQVPLGPHLQRLHRTIELPIQRRARLVARPRLVRHVPRRAEGGAHRERSDALAQSAGGTRPRGAVGPAAAVPEVVATTCRRTNEEQRVEHGATRGCLFAGGCQHPLARLRLEEGRALAEVAQEGEILRARQAPPAERAEHVPRRMETRVLYPMRPKDGGAAVVLVALPGYSFDRNPEEQVRAIGVRVGRAGLPLQLVAQDTGYEVVHGGLAH